MKLTSHWSLREGKRAALHWFLWIQLLWSACSLLAAVLLPQSWGPVLILLAAVFHTLSEARNTLLIAPCSVSPPSVPLFLTCMSPPSEKPPKATPRPLHLASVVLPISVIIIVCWIAVFSNALSDSESVTLTCAMAIPSECWWNKLTVGKPIRQTRITHSLYFVILID